MKEVQRANAVGEPLELIDANIVSGHKIKAIEKHLIHVKLENPSFDSRTGQKTSKPFIQSFYVNEFDKMVKDNSFAGLTVEKIHDPRRPMMSKQDGTNIDGSTQVPGPAADAPKIPNAADETDPVDIMKMNKAELEQKYFDLAGEDAPKATKAELIELIKTLEEKEN